MNTVLDVRGLEKRTGSFRLKDVNFSLLEGCITGLIGVNGAGKTTTIKLLLGLMMKDAGEVRFFGRDSKEDGAEVKDRIGVVLDEGYFYEDLTLREMKSVLAPAYTRWDEVLFRRYMDRFELHPNRKISTLSKGMRMKYAIALALSHHADLLIMDEPASGLDPQVRLELRDLLLEYVRDGNKSVFLSSHITSDLDKIADALVLLHEGQVLLCEEKDILLDRHGLVKGDVRELNERTRELFLTLDEHGWGFTGLTADKKAVCKQMTKVLIERPAVEDIMLGYIRGGVR